MTRFRTAGESDVDGIVELMRGYYAEDGYPFGEAEARAALLALIGDERLGRLWVVHEREELIGYLAVTLGYSLEYRGRDAFVDELFIAAGHRRRGLGREAMEIAEAYCREIGVRALHLEVERHRQPAAALYERAGFESHDRRLLTKRLDPAKRQSPGA